MQAHHVRIGLKQGRVKPSSLVIAPGRIDGEPDASPISAATGILGAMAIGAVFWGGVIAYLLS